MNAQNKIEGEYDPAREVFLTDDSTYWISYFDHDLAQISKNGYVGLIDRSGKILCLPKYDKIFISDEQMIKVTLNGKYGVIDRNGKELIKPQYSQLITTPIGSCIVAEKELFGVVDTLGKLRIPCSYDSVMYLFDDVFKVFDKSVETMETYRPAGRWGVISIDGEIVVPIACDVVLKINEQYGVAQRFVTNLTTPSQKNPDTLGITLSIQGIGAYFDKNGTINFDTPIPNSRYLSRPTGFRHFSGGQIPAAYFEYHTRTEFLDRERIPDWLVLYPNTPLETINGRMVTTGVIVSDGKKMGYKDLTGKLILPYIYDSIEETDLGTLSVTLKGETYLIDKKGKRIH